MTNEKTTLVKTSPAEFDNFLLTKSLSITNYASVLKYGQRLSTHFINNEAFLWMMTMSTIDPNIKSNEQRYTKQNSMHTNRLRPCRKKKNARLLLPRSNVVTGTTIAIVAKFTLVGLGVPTW